MQRNAMHECMHVSAINQQRCVEMGITDDLEAQLFQQPLDSKNKKAARDA